MEGRLQRDELTALPDGWLRRLSIAIGVALVSAMLIHPRITDAPEIRARVAMRSPRAPDQRRHCDRGDNRPDEPALGHTRIIADRRHEHYCQPLLKFPMTTWRSGSLRCPRALSRDSGARRPKAVLGDPRAGAAPARSGTGPVPHRVAGLRHPGRAGLPYDLRRRRTASVINPDPRAEGRWIQPDATTGLRMMLRRARQRDADRLSRGINRPPRNTASIVL